MRTEYQRRWYLANRERILSGMGGGHGHKKGSIHPQWTEIPKTYRAQHKRVEYYKGKAAEYECFGVGCNNKARDWANLMGDYADIEDYLPLCRPCHKQFDRKEVE